MTGSYLEQTQTRKVWRVGDSLVGCAGAYEECLEFVAWFAAGEDHNSRPSNMDNFDAIVIDADGNCYNYGSRLLPMPVGKPNAIGSGAQFAMGAMLAGASADKAVKIAIKLDSYTGGRVRKYTLR